MQKTKRHILSTRPLSAAVLEEAKEQNVFIDCISFIETESVQTRELEEKLQKLSLQNLDVVFTSMNAVESVKNHLTVKPDWKIFSIGQTTKELVKEFFGENSVFGTADDASQLADVIIRNHPKKVFFFCGDQRRDEMPEKLNDAGIALEEIVVYKTSSTSKKINKEYDGILFFSPSAVDSFFTTNKIAGNTILFAIGNTTAAAAHQRANNKIVIADKPGKEELVKKMLAFFSQEKQRVNE